MFDRLEAKAFINGSINYWQVGPAAEKSKHTNDVHIIIIVHNV